MDRLDAMAMVVAAIDEGSLAAAARRFGRSAAAATRAVALLEDAAGERLLLRSTRGLRLTEAGERHAAVWRDVLGRLDELRGEARGGGVAGTLVLTAPELFGRMMVAPVLEAFLELHPAVEARALLLNRVVDMVGEGVDVAIRLAHLPASSMTALRLGHVRQIVCAAPDYLARCPAPDSPADLARHACLGMGADGNRESWSFRRAPDDPRTRSVAVATRLAITGVAAAIEAALRGRGLVRCMSYQADALLASGRLVRVLAAFEPEPIPVQIVFRPHPRRHSPVRAFVDHAAPILRRELGAADRRLSAPAAIA